jgi:biopolymer transport protein ExbD
MYKLPKKKMLGQDAIPTTSLADMMFLLLIFFIMTTTLSRVTGIVSDMPAGTKAQQPQSEKTPMIMLHDNKITMNDQEMTREGLERTLRGLKLDQKSGNAKVVILATEGNVSYQDYYQTMAFIQGCGGIVAIESEEAEGAQ